MNNATKLILGALLLLGVAAAGYWIGTHSRIEERGLRSEAKTERKLLYYRNPMGLPDTSPVPKKDAMGMDYVPVYEGEADSGNQLNIAIDKVQKLGVKSEAAALRELNRTLRVTGRIETDERRTYTIAPKFEGWVERLYVNTTGQPVSKGQPLFDVYSPELVSAQREHALAVQGLASLKDADEDAKKSMQQLAAASAARLKNWDIADTPLTELPSPQSSDGTTSQSTKSASGRGGERKGQSLIPARPHITFRAPVSGIVLEKKAVQGMRFMPGEMLYQIADLSSVWVIAEVPEQDIGQVRLGSHVQVKVDAYPDRGFDGKVDFIYPTLNSATRSVQLRIQIANPQGLLKPAMYASAQIAPGKGNKVLTVPASAVIDNGTRQVVLVRLAEGRFEPRVVTLGSHSDDYIEIQSGIAEGEQVVTSANFLLDSESNLKAALGGMNESTAPSATPASPAQHEHKSVGHQAQGTLESINNDGTVSITHGPIASLGWPGMTMDFPLTNSSLVAGIKPGSAISFELVERKPGEYVITKMQALHQHEDH
jgi:Cu(I)/Ag(I) efflux system membrane fusion protein